MRYGMMWMGGGGKVLFKRPENNSATDMPEQFRIQYVI
jgi:hypothetical protein